MAENMRITQPKLSVKHGNKGSAVLAVGTVTLDGGNPTPVDCLAVHGIGTVQGAVACLSTASALGDLAEAVTATWTGSTLNIYAWTNTSGTDPTLVASTDNTLSVSYVVWGTV